MPFLEKSWNPEAQALGYENEKEMLQDLYEVNGFTIKEIARMLGFSFFNVRKRAMSWGIRMRTRGGPNNVGNRRLKGIPDAELFSKSPAVLAQEWGVHIATVFSEKRLRERTKELMKV